MNLSSGQRQVVFLGIIVTGALVLFPPWREGAASLGYSPIFSAPHSPGGAAVIDQPRWLVPIGFSAAATALLVWIGSVPKADDNRDRNTDDGSYRSKP